MSLSISQNFNGRTLLRFALPSMVMMIFMSLYTIVDGIFVSRYVGDAALSSINIVYPIISVFTAIGVMLATGGCAVIGKRLGEGKKELARENLTLFVIFSIIISVLLSAIFLCFAKPIVILLGANDVLIPYCVRYLSILMWFAPISVLQLLFLSYFVVASKPNLGLFLTVLSGIINVVLDYVFLDIFQAGIEGAAFATGIGQTIPAIVVLIVFFNKKKELHFCKFKWDGKALLKACSNGASEMVTHMSAAIVTFLFNIIMMKLAGESGVAAITIVLYGQFLFH